MPKIPATMRAVVLHAYDVGSYTSLAVEERPTPQPGRGEVLVRMAASPINPSDLASLQGRYAMQRPLPMVPGIEDCGTVVKAGRGYLARRLVGKRVACVAGANSFCRSSAVHATSVTMTRLDSERCGRIRWMSHHTQ